MKKIVLLLCVLLMSGAAKAEVVAATPEQITAAEQYLNTLTTVTSDFIQVGPEGDIANGTFYLSRPGKLRWQYQPPVPIVITANSGTITYYDAELDQISYLSEKETLASFLTRKNIAFKDDINLVGATIEDGVLKIMLAQKGKEDEGSMMLVFEQKPLLLRKIEITDPTKKKTSINFNNPQYGMKLDDKLFVVKNPRIFKSKNK